MNWLPPPDIKIYEALGAVADGRVHAEGNTGKVYSSSGNKFYEVRYDAEKQAITANDNGSYWKKYLGYPAIAFLMQEGALPYDENLGAALKGVAWKDINQKFKNDFEKTLELILKDLSLETRKELEEYVAATQEKIKLLNFTQLGTTQKPPEGY